MGIQLQSPAHSGKAHSSFPSEATPVFTLSEQEQHHRIAVAAYYLAEHRNFAPGHETEDWRLAELQVGSEGMIVS